MTNRITEHYQENPEGARLVSDNIPGKNIQAVSGKPAEAGTRGGPGKKNAAGKSGKPSGECKPSGVSKPDRSARPVKTEKTAKTGKAAPGKSSSPVKQEKPPKKSEVSDEEQPEEQSQSVKTPSVMRLVEERAFSENQVVAAGKSRIPRQLRKMEPLSKVLRREAQEEERADMVSSSPLVMRDLAAMVIADCVPGIIKRFNACDCEKCVSELERLTAAEIPSRYMRLPELADLGWDGFTDEERLIIEKLKKSAVTVMIRLMIGNKKRNFHG